MANRATAAKKVFSNSQYLPKMQTLLRSRGALDHKAEVYPNFCRN